MLFSAQDNFKCFEGDQNESLWEESCLLKELCEVKEEE